MFIDLENHLKVPKITVLGLIVQVLLQYKVGAIPELGPNFREVYAAGLVLPIIGVSDASSFCGKTCEKRRLRGVRQIVSLRSLDPSARLGMRTNTCG